jgi:hypothetical protein
MTEPRTVRDDQGSTKPAEQAVQAPARPIRKPLASPPRLQHRVLLPVTPVPARSVPATTPVKRPDTPPAAVVTTTQQTALSVTREILKNLAILKKAFLRVVVLLGQVRDEKLYAELGYATIEAYAGAQLSIKRTVLQTYLRVYDWMRQTHPAWLKPGARLKLADLNDAADLIWIEKQLARENLPAAHKASLQDLRKKALDGTLRRSEVRAYKAKGNKIASGNRAFLAKLRRLRKYGAGLAGLPGGVITHLDDAIDLLKNEVEVANTKAGKKGAKRPMAPK